MINRLKVQKNYDCSEPSMPVKGTSYCIINVTLCILTFLSCRVFTQDAIQQQLLKAKSEPLFEDTTLVAVANSLNGAKFVIHPGPVSHQLGPLLNDHLNAKVYLSAQNLFTISSYKEPDPEVQGGLDQAEYPRPRTFMMGEIVQFH